MPRPLIINPDQARTLYRRYEAGESMIALGRASGCSEVAVRHAFVAAGFRIRTHSEAGELRARRAPEQLSAARRTAAAACRGRRQSAVHRERIAIAKQSLPNNGPRGENPIERRVRLALRRRGIVARPQRAIGPYNADLMIGRVVVEIYTRKWHARGPAAARHERRSRTILRAGFHLIIVWIDDRFRDRWNACIDQIQAFCRFADEQSSAPPEYLVVQADGRLAIRISGDVSHLPAVVGD